jgi:hypothetical protein
MPDMLPRLKDGQQLHGSTMQQPESCWTGQCLKPTQDLLLNPSAAEDSSGIHSWQMNRGLDLAKVHRKHSNGAAALKAAASRHVSCSGQPQNRSLDHQDVRSTVAPSSMA